MRCCARSVIRADLTQETCARRCRLYASHPATWATSYRSYRSYKSYTSYTSYRSYRSGIDLPCLTDQQSRSWTWESIIYLSDVPIPRAQPKTQPNSGTLNQRGLPMRASYILTCARRAVNVTGYGMCVIDDGWEHNTLSKASRAVSQRRPAQPVSPARSIVRALLGAWIWAHTYQKIY